MEAWSDTALLVTPAGLLAVASGAEINVYYRESGNRATIYSDNALTVLGNPFVTSTHGRYTFYAQNGRYRVTIDQDGYDQVVLDDVLLLDVSDGGVPIISITDRGAVGGGADDQAAINEATQELLSGGSGVLWIPRGAWIMTKPWKIQNMLPQNRSLIVRGEGRGNPYVQYTSTHGSIIVGDTGGVLLDGAGANHLTLEDIGLFYGLSNPSTIMMLLQRINAAGSGYCEFLQTKNISVQADSRSGVNGGVGSVAYINKRGEHHRHENSWFVGYRAYIADGNSQYTGLVSPDYAETVPAGATTGIGEFENCGFVTQGGVPIELISTSRQRISGYIQLPNNLEGVRLGVFNNQVDLDVHVEAAGGVTPTALVRNTGNVKTIRARLASAVPGLTAFRTAGGGAIISGAQIDLTGNFTNVLDYTTEAGGPIINSEIWVDSEDGHVLPATQLYNVGINNKSIAAGSFKWVRDYRPFASDAAFPTHAWATLGSRPFIAATGTDTTPATTETYIAEVFVPHTTLLTGIDILNGTAVAGNVTVGLADSFGAPIAAAKSASTAQAGVASVQKIPFAAPYLAIGPATYFVQVQFNNVGARFRTHSLGVGRTTKQTVQTYGTFTSFTGPTAFVADQGPIGGVYG